MSDAVTALAGASFDGRIRVKDAGLQGMISLRIDTENEDAVTALRAAGYEMPRVGRAGGHLSNGILWMSPDEVLLLCAYDGVEATIDRVTAHLQGHHFLLTDVSDARCVIELAGEGAALREVISKLTPADLRPAKCPPGRLRRTRLAQVPAAIWFEDENTAIILAFRSVADYVFDLLANAAQGAEVGHF